MKDLRKTDPEPQRATPKARPRKKAEKPYGFKYEIRMPRSRNRSLVWVWETWWNWYETAKQRDQAMRAFKYHRISPDMYRNPTPVERGGDNG